MADRWTRPVLAFQRAAELLTAELADLYWPDGSKLDDVTVIPVQEAAETETEGGVIVETKVRTFEIRTELLGGLVPVRDMEIIWRGDTFRAYQPPGRKVFDYTDHHEAVLRIRTVKVPVSVLRAAYANPSGTVYANPTGTGYRTPE